MIFQSQSSVLEQDDGVGIASEAALIDELRCGNEAAFVQLLDRYGNAMLRVAMMYVPSRAVAEEVVQETWLGVFQGIGRFEGRSSLKTWIFRILTNRAKTRGEREGRSVPFSALADAAEKQAEPAVDPATFHPADHEDAGWWVSYPQNWSAGPERRLLAQETCDQIRTAIAALPANQRTVISLRDIEGWAADEICQVLGISETNQRVLLHRARSKVRARLEQYLATAEDQPHEPAPA
jgi:RNA polymerase sigma-70 factor (ECF subfamily)